MDEVLSDFCTYLCSLGIPSISVKYYGTNYLSINVQKISEVLPSKAIAMRHSKEIITFFHNLLGQYGVKARYSADQWEPMSVTYVYSEDAKYLDKIIRYSKHELITRLMDLDQSGFCPKYVFCHSGDYDNWQYPAGYNIIFDQECVLIRSNPEIQNMITDMCHDIIKKNDFMGKYKPEYLQVEFYHAADVNLYGMSRED